MDAMLTILIPMMILGILLGRRCLELESELDLLEDKIIVLEALLDANTSPTSSQPEENHS